jgi:hypothetical protein
VFDPGIGSLNVKTMQQDFGIFETSAVIGWKHRGHVLEENVQR